jgi:hypothetical protein
LESVIATPHPEGSTYPIATPQLFKEMLLHNHNSAIAIFPEVRNFKSATWELTVNFSTWELKFRNFWHIFGCGIRSIHGKKIGGKKSCATVPVRQVFGFQRNRRF